MNAPSGIVTDNALNADVGETTSITGGVIASRSGDLTLETERLETADIDLHRKGRQVSGSVGVSVGSNPEGKSKPGITVEGAYSNSETEGVARATIGEGEIIVRDGDGDGIKAADLEAEADAAEAEGDTARAEALRTEADREAAEDKTTTETQLANINRDPDAVVVVTSRKEEGFELYLSDTSLEKAVEGIEVTGKALGEAFRALGEELAASGALTPSELDTAKTVAKAIDEGDLDLRALVTCSGRRGFNLWDLVVSSAHAATGCVLFDENGREIAELTPREREACVQMLSRLLEEYARDYLVGERGDTELPASITKTAETLREMASDEVLVAGAQSLGMSVSLIRDVSMRLALGEEKYAEYKEALKPLADAGELSSEAVARTVERFAKEQGLSNQEVKDLKLVAAVTTAAIVTALGAKRVLINGNRAPYTADVAFATIDEFRKHKGGLIELGDSIPLKGDRKGTVAFVDLDGKPVFGVNSSVLVRDTDKELGRSWADTLGVKYGQGTGQYLTHGEAHSLMRAYEKSRGSMPSTVNMFVDRYSCSFCRDPKALPDLAQRMGIENLNLTFKDGSTAVINSGRFISK